MRVRGEEWAVQKCLPLPMGGHAVYVQGVSELVRHHQAIFLTPIDKDIEPLKPEDTRLVPDTSPSYRQTTLYLRQTLRDLRDEVGDRDELDLLAAEMERLEASYG